MSNPSEIERIEQQIWSLLEDTFTDSALPSEGHVDLDDDILTVWMDGSKVRLKIEITVL